MNNLAIELSATGKADEARTLEEQALEIRRRTLDQPQEKPDPSADGPRWTPLFNGKDLTGWTVDGGDRGSWRVDGGDLVVDGSGDRNEERLLAERPRVRRLPPPLRVPAVREVQ